MMTPLPTKTKTDAEILLERFNQWADERIFDLSIVPTLSAPHQSSITLRIAVLQSAKANLKRLAQEVRNETQ